MLERSCNVISGKELRENIVWTWKMCSNFNDKVMIIGDPDIRRLLSTFKVLSDKILKQ